MIIITVPKTHCDIFLKKYALQTVKLSRRAVENDVCALANVTNAARSFSFPHGRRRVGGEISYGPGASGRPKSVSGRTAATGDNGGGDNDDDDMGTRPYIVVVVVVSRCCIVINIDGLCAAFATVRTEIVCIHTI